MPDYLKAKPAPKPMPGSLPGPEFYQEAPVETQSSSGGGGMFSKLNPLNVISNPFNRDKPSANEAEMAEAARVQSETATDADRALPAPPTLPSSNATLPPPPPPKLTPSGEIR